MRGNTKIIVISQSFVVFPVLAILKGRWSRKSHEWGNVLSVSNLGLSIDNVSLGLALHTAWLAMSNAFS